MASAYVIEVDPLALAPHPNPLPASGARERADAKPLAPFTGRGGDPRAAWEGEGQEAREPI
jgi:hypothetical protein